MAMSFSEWTKRWEANEYALFRHRSRGIQFAGPDIGRRLDQCMAANTIDLDDPTMPPFKATLVREGIISPARAEEIFAPTPANGGGGNGGGGIPEAPVNGNLYGRRDAAWAEVVGAEGGGIAGPPGPPGPQGDPGPTGEPGPPGANGVDGQQGPQGDLGPQGTQGPQGPAGAEGPQGQAGAEGAQGVPGEPGTQGPAGVDGAEGPPGPAGAVGGVGPQGTQGPAGNDGAGGPAGPAGEAGPQGAQGLAGPEGAQGVIGPAGPLGPEGAQGTQGPQGAPGPSSDTWGYTYSNVTAEPPNTQQFRFDNVDLQAATKIWIDNKNLEGVDIANYLQLIEIDDELYIQDKNDSTAWDTFTATDLPLTKTGYVEIAIAWARGSAKTVLNSQASVISLLRKGNVGATGPQGGLGPEGPAGPMGPQGIQGPQGLQGETGPAGARGADGAPGALGPQGPQGIEGMEGPEGEAGPAGIAGTQGPQGAVGAEGPAGPQGVQGTGGAQGVQGPQGIPGPTAVSANAGNTATLGSDSLVFVPLAPGPSNAVPAMDSVAAVGSGTSWSRGDHVHPSDTTRAPVKGTIAADQSAAGNIGEVLSTSITAGVTLTTNVVSNVGSLVLTPGDWDVSGQVVFNPGTNLTVMAAALSLTTAALPTGALLANGTGAMQQLRATFASSASEAFPTGTMRVNVSANTTVYLVAMITGTGTWNATGFVRARRMR